MDEPIKRINDTLDRYEQLLEKYVLMASQEFTTMESTRNYE